MLTVNDRYVNDRYRNTPLPPIEPFPFNIPMVVFNTLILIVLIAIIIALLGM